jgi:predicted GNAT family acetyltransferase
MVHDGGMTTDQPPLTVHRNEATHRYEAQLGDTLAGFLRYRERDGEIVLIHTETLDGFEGRGVASAVAQFALDDVRARGAKAVALCPFVRGWLTKHPEYADVVVHAS